MFDKKINPWTMFEIGDTRNVSEKAEQSILKHVSQIEGGHIRMMRLQIETLPHCCHLAWISANFQYYTNLTDISYIYLVTLSTGTPTYSGNYSGPSI